MITVPDKPVKSWKKVYFRMHPEVHRTLKIASVTEGTSMETLFHQALCEKLSAATTGGAVKKPARRNAG
jgi:predicted HicB family RNase H-like nuclease